MVELRLELLWWWGVQLNSSLTHSFHSVNLWSWALTFFPWLRLSYLVSAPGPWFEPPWWTSRNAWQRGRTTGGLRAQIIPELSTEREPWPVPQPSSHHLKQNKTSGYFKCGPKGLELLLYDYPTYFIGPNAHAQHWLSQLSYEPQQPTLSITGW